MDNDISGSIDIPVGAYSALFQEALSYGPSLSEQPEALEKCESILVLHVEVRNRQKQHIYCLNFAEASEGDLENSFLRSEKLDAALDTGWRVVAVP